MNYEEMVLKFICTDFKTEKQYRNTGKKLIEKLENKKQTKMKKLEELKKEIHEIEISQSRVKNYLLR